MRTADDLMRGSGKMHPSKVPTLEVASLGGILGESGASRVTLTSFIRGIQTTAANAFLRCYRVVPHTASSRITM